MSFAVSPSGDFSDEIDTESPMMYIDMAYTPPHRRLARPCTIWRLNISGVDPSDA